MGIPSPDKPPVIEDLESALKHTAYSKDLRNTGEVKRFPSGATVRPFRLDPCKSFEHLAEDNLFLAALKAHQEGNSDPLCDIALELEALGITLEIRTLKGTDLVTGVALVSQDAKIIREILSSSKDQ